MVLICIRNDNDCEECIWGQDRGKKHQGEITNGSMLSSQVLERISSWRIKGDEREGQNRKS